MPTICDRLKRNVLFGSESRWEAEHTALREYLGELYPGLEDLLSVPDPPVSWYPPVTDALSLTDHLIASEKALRKGVGVAELINLRLLIERAVVDTLTPSGESPEADDRLHLVERFTSWAFSVNEPLSVVSTNYDTICDFALLEKAHKLGLADRVDFGMSWRHVTHGGVVHRLAAPSLSILKLHGSLNWLHCPACDCIYINRKGNINRLGFYDKIVDANTCHCGYAPLRPVIVAPSFAREIRNSNVFSVWQSALEALRRADSWILAGYSLPSEDYSIRAILQRAYYGRDDRELKVTVVQHQPDPMTEWRYRLLFPDCDFVTCGFADFLAEQGA
jgi:hypothetical protein